MIVMDFGGKIKGASGIDSYPDWIPLLSLSISAGRALSFPGIGKDRVVSHVDMSEITFSRSSDAASPDLFGELVKATVFPTAKILVLHATNNTPIVTLILTNVMISLYGLGATPDLSESGSLSYSKISYQYDSLDAQGNVVTGTPKIWDLIKQATE